MANFKQNLLILLENDTDNRTSSPQLYKIERGSGNGLYLYLICICFCEKCTRDHSRKVYILIDNLLVKKQILYETLLVKISFFTISFS